MQASQFLVTAMPDLQIRIDDIFGEGDQVAIRFTATGTFTVPFYGIPPTNQPVTSEGLSIARIVDGKIVEVWEKYDTLGMMQQIGAIPTQP